MQLDLRNLIKLVYPEEAGKTSYSVFTENQLAQLNTLIKFYDYYENDVFKYIVKEYPEFNQTEERKPAQVPINYSRYIVDKLASWQFEESIDIAVSSDKKTNEKKADIVEKDLYDIHQKNNMDLKLLQAAKESNTSGGVVVKMIYDKDLGVRLLPRPRIECFPITEFDDYEKLNKVHFVAFKSEDIIWKQTFEMVGDKCQFSEATYSVKNNLQVEEWIQKPVFLGSGSKFIDFLPVYIIPNNPGLGMVWGYSDLDDLIPIIDELNKKYSDSSDALRFEMFAITILLNMKGFTDAKNKESRPKTKPGAVWRLMAEAGPQGEKKGDIFKLESSFAYRETLKEHIEKLTNILFELSDVIEVNPAVVSKLGNLSGVALKLMFASMISKTNVKNTIWKPKLAQIYSDALKMKSVYENYAYPEDLNIEVIIHSQIPLNEKEEVEIATMKLAAGLTSIRAEMDNMGVEDPEALMAEILEEQNKNQEAYSKSTYGEG